MNVLLLTGLFFITVLTQTNFTYKVPELRKTYYQASKDKNTYEKLHQHLSNYKGTDLVVQGFRAGLEGMGAKYAWGPYAKLRHVRNSARMFEEILEKDPANVEVRFLRYTVEYYIPRYLLMSGNLQDDKKVIFSNLLAYPQSGMNAESFKVMRDYFLKGNHSTEDEKKRLRNLKA